MSRVRLRVLLPVTLFVFAVFATVPLGLFRSARIRADALDAARETVDMAMTQLQETFAAGDGSLGFPIASQRLASVAVNPNVITLFMTDDAGNVTAANRNALIGRPATEVEGFDPGTARTAATKNHNEVVEDVASDRLRGYYPVVIGAEPGKLRADRMGLLFIEYDLAERMHRARSEALAESVLFSLASLLLAVGLGFILDVLVSRRVARIARAADAFASGDTSARSGISGADEVGRTGVAFDGMAERIEHEQRVLRDSEERYRALFEGVSDAIFVVDDEGVILDVNDVAVERLGYARERLVGSSVKSIDTPEAGALVAERLERLQRQGRIVFESEQVTASGEVIPVEIVATTFVYRGRPAHLSVARDIAARKTAEEALRRLNAELELRVAERTRELEETNEELTSVNEELTSVNEELFASNDLLRDTNDRLDEATRAKSAFLATMSHELRTPLNSVIGFTGVLLQGMAGPLNDEQTTQLTMVSKAAHHLLGLINEILDLSQIEAGRLRISLSEFDISECVGEAIDTVMPLADEKGLELALECGGGCGTMKSDRSRVEQALINVLGNAVKFTDAGSVVLELSHDADHVVFAVRDTGCGIPKDLLPKVFDEFYQVPHADSQTQGTGLGLSVTKRLVEALGGSITASSEVGKGSTFTIRLPSRQDTDPAGGPGA